MENRPLELSEADFDALAQISEIRQLWGAESVEHMRNVLKDHVYSVKFDYVSGSPGYCGDLYILMGDYLQPPVVVTRNYHNKLHVVLGLDEQSYNALSNPF
jgi:hypothetical protein